MTDQKDDAPGLADHRGAKESKADCTVNSSTRYEIAAVLTECVLCGDLFVPRRNRRHVCLEDYWFAPVITLERGTFGYRAEQIARGWRP